MSTRQTKQKEIIYAVLRELGNHPTADMVYAQVHDRYPSISRATVFRVLRQMSDAEQIGRVPMYDGADCFDHNAAPHFHGRCKICRKLFDIYCEKPPISSFLLTDCGGFSISDYSLLFDGICEECRKGQKENISNG